MGTSLDSNQVVDRTEAINKIPSKPGLIQSLGFFKTRNVAKDTITFDVRDGAVSTLSDKLRSTSDKNTREEQPYDVHTLAIPHFPVESTISRDQIAGVRGFGSDFERSVASALAEHLEDHQSAIDYHVEYQQAKMLFDAQLVTDHYGTYDMATELGVAQGTKTLSYAAEGDTLRQFREMQSAAKSGLLGGGARGYYFLAGEEMYEWLLANADVREAMKHTAWQGANPILGEVDQEVAAGYQAFRLGNTTVVLYDDSFTLADGSQDAPLASTAGLFVPRAEIGKQFFGPENTLSGLSGGGQRAFSRTYRDHMDRFVNVNSETNSLPITEAVASTIKVDFTA